jgi:hypothetical protein
MLLLLLVDVQVYIKLQRVFRQTTSHQVQPYRVHSLDVGDKHIEIKAIPAGKHCVDGVFLLNYLPDELYGLLMA